MTLDNTNARLIEGVVSLLRENVDGWSVNSEYGVDNVWGKNVPTSAEEEFPRGAVDITAGSDFDLSVELDVRLREVFLKITVFGEVSSDVEELVEKSENTITKFDDAVADNPQDSWTKDEYLGDWSIREVDGFTELVEESETEGKLRYNRSVDIIAECVKQTD